jgi:hypothetical protein
MTWRERTTKPAFRLAYLFPVLSIGTTSWRDCYDLTALEVYKLTE